MTESNPRAPEVQTICLRPLDVAAVLYKYRPKRPGEVIDEDAWPPGYGCLPDPPAAARGNGSAAPHTFPQMISRRSRSRMAMIGLMAETPPTH
jgi:hypothetical protein